MAHTVFICHSSKDKAVADAACATLESRGISCWIAPRDILPGDEYGAAIINALDECSIVLMVFSANSNDSPQVHREIERAVSKNKTLVPFRIEDIVPCGALEYALMSSQWFDALSPPLQRYLDSLSDDIAHRAQVAVPSASFPVAQPVGLPNRPLTQFERLIDTFAAPVRTFQDILINATWWLPFLVSCVIGIAFAWVLMHRIGMDALVDGSMRSNPGLLHRLASESPAQVDAYRATLQKSLKSLYFVPYLRVLAGLVIAGIYWLLSKFLFRGRATYAQLLAVFFYGTLPLGLGMTVIIAAIYAGMTSTPFNLNNPIGSNIGFYLQGGHAPMWLVTLCSFFDVSDLWSFALQILGISIVARIKRTQAAVVVLSWWVAWVILQTLSVALTNRQ